MRRPVDLSTKSGAHWDGQNPGQWIQNIYHNIFFGVYVRYITYVCQLVRQILSTLLWCFVVMAGVKSRLGCYEIDSYPLFKQCWLHKIQHCPPTSESSSILSYPWFGENPEQCWAIGMYQSQAPRQRGLKFDWLGQSCLAVSLWKEC